MLMICRRRVPLVALLLLLQLISGAAWASNETPDERSDESESAPCTHHKNSNTEPVEVWKGVIVTNIDFTTVSESNIAGTPREEADDETQAAAPAVSSPPHVISIDDLQLRRRKSPTQLEAAQITTAPLLARQDQSQVDQLNAQLQSLRQSAQQALQALSDQSRSVSQASQQLGQESSRLSLASSQLSASSLQLSLQLSIATNSVQSLTAALSAAISSGNSAFASCTSSASSILATSLGAALAQATQARVSCFYHLAISSAPLPSSTHPEKKYGSMDIQTKKLTHPYRSKPTRPYHAPNPLPSLLPWQPRLSLVLVSLPL